jgi:hypothetical protein
MLGWFAEESEEQEAWQRKDWQAVAEALFPKELSCQEEHWYYELPQ